MKPSGPTNSNSRAYRRLDPFEPCPVCGDSSNRNGRNQCKICTRAAQSIYRLSPQRRALQKKRNSSPEAKAKLALYRKTEKGKSRKWESAIRLRYGITAKIYETMLAEQGGVCAVCKSPSSGRKSPKFHIDHDHDSGALRGLLCNTCNNGMGLTDSPDLLLAKVAYLAKYGKVASIGQAI